MDYYSAAELALDYFPAPGAAVPLSVLPAVGFEPVADVEQAARAELVVDFAQVVRAESAAHVELVVDAARVAHAVLAVHVALAVDAQVAQARLIFDYCY